MERAGKLSYMEWMDLHKTFEVNDLLDEKLASRLDGSGHKYIVIGAAVGTLTMEHVPIYFEWNEKAVFHAFEHAARTVYFATDLLAVDHEEMDAQHEKLGRMIEKMSQLFHERYTIISFFHSETENPSLEKLEILHSVRPVYRGIIMIPCSLQDDIFTYNDLQYRKEGDSFWPDKESSFYRYAPSLFGHHSVVSLTVEELRTKDLPLIKDKLLSGAGFPLVIVNAVNEADLKIFTIAVLELLQEGYPFLFQSASSFLKVISGSLSRNLDFPFLEGRKGFLLSSQASANELEAMQAKGLRERPDFIIIGKDFSIGAAVKMLRLEEAEVLGQLERGISIWKGNENSLFPDAFYMVSDWRKDSECIGKYSAGRTEY